MNIFLQFKSLEEPGHDHSLTELLVSSSSPEEASPWAVCMPSDCSVVQLFIALGCRNPPSPETALVPESGSGWRAEWAWFWWDNLCLGGERRVLGRTQMQDTGRRCGVSENTRVGRSWFNPSWQSSPRQPVTYSPLYREENQNGKSETTQWLR